MDKSRNPEQLFEVGGWFDQMFIKRKLGERMPTWRAALSLFVRREGSVIVETGCQRVFEDEGDGCSTTIFASLLDKLGTGILHSVDISQENLSTAKAVVSKLGCSARVRLHSSDSQQFLQNFNGPIDLLYLDSWDYFDKEPQLSVCQEHQLGELKAAFAKLSFQSVVLLDDNDFPCGGKTRLAKQFLAEHNWFCLLDWKQSLWTRTAG